MKKVLFCFITLCLVLSCNKMTPKEEYLLKLNQNKEYDKILRIYPKYIKEDSLNYIYNFVIGNAYLNTKQFEKALPYYMKSKHDSIPNKSISGWSNTDIGLIYQIKGNFDLSAKYYEKAILLDEKKGGFEFARIHYNSLPTNKEYKSWKIIDTKYIRFYFQDRINTQLHSSFVKSRIYALDSLISFFNYKPTKKIQYFVWHNNTLAKEFLNRNLGFSLPLISIIHSKEDQSKGHELTHIFTYHAFDNIANSRLINEGIAVYLDMEPKIHNIILNDDKIQITKIWNDKDIPEKIYYPIAGKFIEFLLEKGNKKQLLALLHNQTLENAHLVYKDFDKLVFEFEKSLNK